MTDAGHGSGLGGSATGEGAADGKQDGKLDATLVECDKLFPRIMAFGSLMTRVPYAFSDDQKAAFGEAESVATFAYDMLSNARTRLRLRIHRAEEKGMRTAVERLERIHNALKVELNSLSDGWEVACTSYVHDVLEPTLASAIRRHCGEHSRVIRLQLDSYLVSPAITPDQWKRLDAECTEKFGKAAYIVMEDPNHLMNQSRVKNEIRQALQHPNQYHLL